jgi:two-component system alkaline phosphatase synthesis response regulator PhoP
MDNNSFAQEQFTEPPNMGRPPKILVVDDEPDIVEFLQYNLEKQGFETITALNGKDAIRLADEHEPDLILLDIMMPMMDGVETCREMKKNPKLEKTLIAFLTARNEEYSEIAGLDAGADDYIQKPIRPRLLLSRINALLRRKFYAPDEQSNIIEIENLRIDTEKFQVFLDDEVIVVAKKEFEILVLFASHPGKVFSRDEIFRKVWGYSESINSRTIDVHISKLREKLKGGFIKTLKGIGYKLDV